jgi:hypothetical protein
MFLIMGSHETFVYLTSIGLTLALFLTSNGVSSELFSLGRVLFRFANALDVLLITFACGSRLLDVEVFLTVCFVKNSLYLMFLLYFDACIWLIFGRVATAADCTSSRMCIDKGPIIESPLLDEK